MPSLGAERIHEGSLGKYCTVLTWYQLPYKCNLHHITVPSRIKSSCGTWVLIWRGPCGMCDIQHRVGPQEHLVLTSALLFCEYPINKHIKPWYLKAHPPYAPYGGGDT